jgi:uncharacterized membrane protein YjjP (DUF1212 family)
MADPNAPQSLPNIDRNMAKSQDASQNSSDSPSRTDSLGGEEAKGGKGQHRVKFSIGGGDESDEAPHEPPRKPLPQMRVAPTFRPPQSYFPKLIDTDSTDVTESSTPALGSEDHERDIEFSQSSANKRARRLADRLGSSPAPVSRRNSLDDASAPPPLPADSQGYPVRVDDIPLVEMKKKDDRRPYSLYEDSTDEDDEGLGPLDKGKAGKKSDADRTHEDHLSRTKAEALRLVRAMTRRFDLENAHAAHRNEGDVRSGQATPAEERDGENYVPKPSEFKPSILSMLLKVYDQHGVGAALNRQSLSGPSNPSHHDPKSWHRHTNSKQHSSSQSNTGTPGASSQSSGTNTPHSSGKNTPRGRKWYEKQPSVSASTSSLAGLLDASLMMGSPGAAKAAPAAHKPSASRPHLPRSGSTGILSSAMHKLVPKHENPHELLITVHIAEVLARQRYLLTLCRALMEYGAPTHRLEEYMRMSARVLQIEGQFLYLPGCMIVSFDDRDLHTTEVKLVKASHGVDLGKFRDVFDIYKEVVHDLIGVEEAMQRLNDVNKRPLKFNVWIKILMYGLASAFVGPFAFGARPIDMPVAFALGCILGILQLWVAPRSDLYANVFEITASIVTSFVARGMGSIRYKDGTSVFCFSALAQSSIALILPGYVILCGSLELQSRNIVAGSVRMVYAIIFALMLGFGITIGTAIYGLMDRNATSVVTCPSPDSLNWWTNNVYLSHFPWVPLFTLCLIIINQAKWKQAPVMLFIAFAGYQVNFWSAKRFANNVQIANALGAFAIGVLGNLYSRVRHGLAAAALLPAIFVQVPSGLAASGSLVSGLTSADQITGNATGISVINNGTQGFADAQNSTMSSSGVYSGTVFNVGYGMVQVAIGISVGLFLSALVVYPFGKKRSGLFSF